MRENIDLDSAPAGRQNEGGNVGLNSESATDPALVALIRRVLGPSFLPSHSDGYHETAEAQNASANRIGKFEVLREIGQGGFGTVMLVRDPDLGRERALKVPNPETLNSPGALARFLAEARLASRVDHPNVVRIYEAETTGIVPYIVMEYCPEGSLGQWLATRSRQDHLPERWVAALAAEIAEGVHQAHLAGLLHRDLKPGNILLERIGHDAGAGIPQFRPKIADFGLAKIVSSDETPRSMTASGNPLGTWAYMSPEQARGNKNILATTDVYAIGAILYELHTGTRLYANLSQPEILRRLLSPDASPSPRIVRQDLHRDLETITLKCLEKRPGDRYQNPRELVNDLRRYLDGLPILARPSPIWKQGLAKLKRHPLGFTLTSLTLLSAIAGVIVWAHFRNLKHRGEIDALLNRLESATVAQLPELIPKIDPTDQHVTVRLTNLFAAGHPSQKLAAALVLAKSHAAYRDYAYTQLLQAKPEEIGPIARLLRGRSRDLPDRLLADAERPPRANASLVEVEANDHLRATAACALILSTENNLGWSFLQFRPDPQVSSFLIQQLGHAGISPETILRQLKDESHASIRDSLILVLGEGLSEIWQYHVQRPIFNEILSIYTNDPDQSVHAAAKWFLLRTVHNSDEHSQELSRQLALIDAELAAHSPSDAETGWRIIPQGLTFSRIAIPVASPGRVRIIDVSDTEVTVSEFLKRFPNHPYDKNISPFPDCPINSICWYDAANFCNQLSDESAFAGPEKCYAVAANGRLMPAESYLRRRGYRLLTAEEFTVACRANTTAKRFYGNTQNLMNQYAWYRGNADRTMPVASLKPNHFGLFDTLGNLSEWCERPTFEAGVLYQATVGWSITAIGEGIRSDALRPARNDAAYSWPTFGFRVARTIIPETEDR